MKKLLEVERLHDVRISMMIKGMMMITYIKSNCVIMTLENKLSAVSILIMDQINNIKLKEGQQIIRL